MNTELKNIQLIGVTGYWEDCPFLITETLFGRMPEGYTGDGSDLPHDDAVQYWLEHDEPLEQDKTYGDFVFMYEGYGDVWSEA